MGKVCFMKNLWKPDCPRRILLFFFFFGFFLETSYMAYNTTKQIITYKPNLLIKPYNSLLATFTIAKLKSEKNPAMGERDVIYF